MTTKVPSLVIKRLTQEEIMQYTEGKIHNRQGPVNSSKRKASRKRKKPSQSETNATIGDFLLIDEILESDESAKNNNNKDSTECSEEHYSKNPSFAKSDKYNVCKSVIEKTIPPSMEHIPAGEQLNMGKDISEEIPTAVNICIKLCPSSNVEEFAQYITTSEAVLLTGKILDPPAANVPVINRPDLSFNSGVNILNSPAFATPMNCIEHILSRVSCLVPQHLKSLIGHATIETCNVKLLILEWNVGCLLHEQHFKDLLPPGFNALKNVASSYEGFEDYYNTYFPLLLLDAWHRIRASWMHFNRTSPYLCHIKSYSVKSHYVSVKCHTILCHSTQSESVFPYEGKILMVKYSTKSNEYAVNMLGYLTQVKAKRYNPLAHSKLRRNLRMTEDVKPEFLLVLTLVYMGAYNCQDIDTREPISVHVLCNVKPILKQNDALLYVSKSPLQGSILNPIGDGCLRNLTLAARTSPPEQIKECVRDITRSILSPLPFITVVKAKPESDRLNIIPLLIEEMKTAYKTKVLLCVRTVRALTDIAANICLYRSLKLVIVSKRRDISPQFHKYLLDELGSAEFKKGEGGMTHIKREVSIKMKKRILSDCDVVLSLVRKCHDGSMGEAFTEMECITRKCCIVDQANLCTEPETLIPLLHGIGKLILIGDYSAKVTSKTAVSFAYNQSFLHRALDLVKDY